MLSILYIFFLLYRSFSSNSGRRPYTDECSLTRVRMSGIKSALLNLNDGKIHVKLVMLLSLHVGHR